MSEFGGLASSSKLTGGDTDVTNQITLAAHLVTKKLCTRATYDITPPVGPPQALLMVFLPIAK
jgi:hypothetical protein